MKLLEFLVSNNNNTFGKLGEVLGYFSFYSETNLLKIDINTSTCPILSSVISNNLVTYIIQNSNQYTYTLESADVYFKLNNGTCRIIIDFGEPISDVVQLVKTVFYSLYYDKLPGLYSISVTANNTIYPSISYTTSDTSLTSPIIKNPILIMKPETMTSVKKPRPTRKKKDRTAKTVVPAYDNLNPDITDIQDW